MLQLDEHISSTRFVKNQYIFTYISLICMGLPGVSLIINGFIFKFFPPEISGVSYNPTRVSMEVSNDR